MLSNRSIQRFVLLCLASYTFFLLLAWAGFGNTFEHFLRNAGNSTANRLGKGAYKIKFQKNQKFDKDVHDSEFVIMHRDTISNLIRKARTIRHKSYIDVPSINVYFSSSRQAYIPTILLLSLILASPIKFRWRKIWSIGAGLILLYSFFVLKFSIWILYKCNTIDTLGTADALGAFWGSCLHYLYLALSADMPMRFIIPVLIWILVTFRKEDLKKMMASSSKNK